MLPRLLFAFGEQRERYRPDVRRHGTQRQTALGVLANAVPHIYAPDLCRVGGINHSSFLLGQLPTTASNAPKEQHTRPRYAPWS